MKRGEIYRTRERLPERGDKPGFYVVVSRTFIAKHEDVSTVICAPVYGEVLGLSKSKLTHFAGTLSPAKIADLNRALAHALELPLALPLSS